MSEKDKQAYVLVLEDLQRRKKMLELLISKLESFMDPANPEQDSDSEASDVHDLELIGSLRSMGSRSAGAFAYDASSAISPGKFERWTLSSAVLSILDSSPNGCSNAEILKRLAQGGFRFRSKNRAVAVAQCLKRLSEKSMVIRFARGKWGRAEGSGAMPDDIDELAEASA